MTLAFKEFEWQRIDFGFLMLQSCLKEILVSYGDKEYKIPHMGKEMVLGLVIMPICISATPNACVVAREVSMGELDGELEEDANAKSADKGK